MPKWLSRRRDGKHFISGGKAHLPPKKFGGKAPLSHKVREPVDATREVKKFIRSQLKSREYVWPSEVADKFGMGVAETMQLFEKLEKEGKIRKPHMFTYKIGKDVEEAIYAHAKKAMIPVREVKLVGGINIRGYSSSDIDIMVSPRKAALKIRQDIEDEKIKLPHGISSGRVDITEDIGTESEEEWLLKKTRATYPRREHFLKSLTEAQRLRNLTLSQKRWIGKAALKKGSWQLANNTNRH